jgi:alpha-beta hydrolase superfamily lysophospholipase
VQALDRPAFVGQVQKLVRESPYRALLVVVHGFREAFPSALRKTTFLGHVLDINTPVLLFDWPGNQGSSPGGYRRAQRVAKASGAELAHTLELIIRDIQPERLWLIANSMGAQVAVDAFRLLYEQADLADAETEIADVMLTAPDVDFEEFDTHFQQALKALARKTTIYVSSNDRALVASRLLNRGQRRGESTLSPSELEAAARVVDHDPDSEEVTVVDVTPVNRTRNFHNFSLETPEFFDDVFPAPDQQRNPPQPPDLRGPGPQRRDLLDPDPRPLAGERMKRSARGIKRLPLSLRWGVLIALAGAAALTIQGCTNLSLEPWHTEALTAEFTAARPIKSDLRGLSTPGGAVVRPAGTRGLRAHPDRTRPNAGALQPGQRRRPQGRQPNWNRSFELPAEAPAGGVLLLHGMSDSPYSLRALGQSLNQHRFWVIGLRLPGHGTAPSGLLSIRWEDMAAAVQLGVAHLKAKLGEKPIHIIGYSTGAALALDFALDALDGGSRAGAGQPGADLAGHRHPPGGGPGQVEAAALLPGLGGLAWLVVEPEFDPYKYNSFTTNAGEQVHRLTRSVAGRVASRARSHPERVLPPTLVLKSNADATVSTDAVVDRLLGRLDPHHHELVLFDINHFAAKSILLIFRPAGAGHPADGR